MSIYCKHCVTQISEKKLFCNSSCAASYNNKGKRRHGQAPKNCSTCGTLTLISGRKYCSRACAGIGRRRSSEEKKAANAAKQSRYRAKQYRILAPDADPIKIKNIYLNCPLGYEVDHIMPLSKGGKHHENNLQYLTKEENRRKGNRW